MPQPRAYAERRRDTLAMLATKGIDGWLATVGAQPNAVPLPIAWHNETVLVAVPTHWPAGKNLARDPRVRIGVGRSDDSVIIDAQITDSHAVDEIGTAHADLLAAYVAQTGRQPEPGSVFYVFRPRRIQVWRGEYEGRDRTLMHDGMWLVQPTSDD